jgi:hypothetical protein
VAPMTAADLQQINGQDRIGLKSKQTSTASGSTIPSDQISDSPKTYGSTIDSGDESMWIKGPEPKRSRPSDVAQLDNQRATNENFQTRQGDHDMTGNPNGRNSIPGSVPQSNFNVNGAHHSRTPSARQRHLSLGNMGVSASPSHHNFYQQLHQHGALLTASPVEREPSVGRLENLHEMRPFHLIGLSGPLRDWQQYVKSESEISAIKTPATREYYRHQNELLERYMAIDKLLDSGLSLNMLRVYGDDLASPSQNMREYDPRQGAPANIDAEGSPLLGGESRQDKSYTVMFAIYVNFVINFFLLVGKIVVALLTNSMSVIASLVDSVLDFLSTFIIWVSTRLVDQRDWKTKHLYPVGRTRLEPIGVLVFSVLIIVSFLKVADEAVQRLVWGSHEVVDIGIPSIIIMSLTIIVKVYCYLWCRTIDSSAVQALAQDAMTDIVFNTFSMLFPVAGYFLTIWWLDPLGALILSCYIVYSWGST